MEEIEEEKKCLLKKGFKEDVIANANMLPSLGLTPGQEPPQSSSDEEHS